MERSRPAQRNKELIVLAWEGGLGVGRLSNWKKKKRPGSKVTCL